ncbi:hypothetical protein OAS86_00530 [Gammaproteobacteria bacterium]|nr:hypothetical protein [Gammaproteobacteria bacterium]
MENWLVRFAAAITSGRNHSALLSRNLDSLLQWLGGGSGSSSRQLDVAFADYGLSISAARARVMKELDDQLFGSGRGQGSPERILGVQQEMLEPDALNLRYQNLLAAYDSSHNHLDDHGLSVNRRERIDAAYQQLRDRKIEAVVDAQEEAEEAGANAQTRSTTHRRGVGEISPLELQASKRRNFQRLLLGALGVFLLALFLPFLLDRAAPKPVSDAHYDDDITSIYVPDAIDLTNGINWGMMMGLLDPGDGPDVDDEPIVVDRWRLELGEGEMLVASARRVGAHTIDAPLPSRDSEGNSLLPPEPHSNSGRTQNDPFGADSLRLHPILDFTEVSS